MDMLDCILEENECSMSKASSVTYASSVSSKSSEDNNKNSSGPMGERAQAIEYSSQSNEANVEGRLSSLVTATDDVPEKRKLDVKPRESDYRQDTKMSSLKNFMRNKLAGQKDGRRAAGSQSDDSLDFSKLPRCDSNSSTNSNKSHKSKESSSDNYKNGGELLKARMKEQRQQSKLKAYMDSPSLKNRQQPQQNQKPSHVSLFQAPYMIKAGPQIPVAYHGVSSMTPVFAAGQRVMHHAPPMTYHPNHQHPHYHAHLAAQNNMSASTTSLRSALKNSQMNNNNGQFTATTEKRTTNKRVSIDPHPGWNETEKRVWEEFKIIQNMEKENALTPAIPTQQSDVVGANGEAEWRVRRSKDGKHVYIKKTNAAATRTKIMKDRAAQIHDERCGITTDDDAFTVYHGRYWSRDQRKKQLSRHNERRKRIVQKSELKANYENKTEKEMAEMVQRKMTLPVFDNFVTIEEILSQRNRSGIFAGPVHVTTI